VALDAILLLVILAGLQGISQEVLDSARLRRCNWGVLTFRINCR
jgi:ABC-type sugar transport system permease subunit